MIRHLRFIFLLLLFCASGISSVRAQSTFASEEELKTQAAKLFDDDEFEEAYPLYSQLASIYPKDPNYNYRLGVCMLYASDDKEKPIPFLEFAAGKPGVDKEALFYLARAYHLNYRFDDAIKQYQAYKSVASAAKAEKLMVDRQIEMCKNGKKLLRNLTDLVVIDKKEMSRADFFRSYDISDIGGKLLVKPDEDVFKTSLDKKKKEKSIIYLASNNNQVFFSSYGEDAEQGKDIYVIRKLPNGEWSKPQTLGYPVNTEYDEDFPFLHPNGKVLYFCSKGHNSMGGYDIFKTTLNEETNTWNKPVNLDFPINTPDDDILYVTNEDEKEAFFSSARASKTGKTAVYHINVERKPIDVAIIKGAVVKNRDNQALDVKITVKDLNDNVILGIFNSKAANGVYLINIPNGGKFLFTVEATGFATQSDVVEVPVQYAFRPMKQEISYELGTDKLIIKNMFDEVLDDASYMLALNFIKEKSKMDVNAGDAGTATASGAVKDKDTTGQAGSTAVKGNPTSPTKLSNNDIVKIGYADADEAAAEAKDLREQVDIAYTMASEKNDLAQNKAKEAAQLMADANKMTDAQKKEAAMEEAEQAGKEADDLNSETVAAFNLAKRLEFKAAAKDQEAELSMQYAKDLEAAVKSKNADPAVFTKLEDQQKKLEQLAEQNNNPTLANSLKMDVDNKKRELDKAIQASEDIRQEIKDNEALIITTQADADKERNDKVKQGLLDQVAGLKLDTESSKNDLAQNEQKIARLQKDYDGAVNETKLVANVVDQAKTGTSEKAAADVARVDKAALEANVNTIKNAPVVADNTSSSKTPDNTAKTNDAVAVNTGKIPGNTSSAATDNTAKTGDAALTGSSKTPDNASKANDAVASGTAKTPDNTSSSGNTTEPDNTTVAEKPDYSKKYSDEIAAADKITNELDRETRRAQVYKQWNDAIKAELAGKKEAVKTEKDKDRKKQLNADIAALEKEQKDKQKSENTAIASEEKLVKAGATTAGTTAAVPDNTSATPDNTASSAISPATTAAINKKFSDDVAAAGAVQDAGERDKAKADALNAWSKALDEDIAKKKSELASTDDPEMKALLDVKIKEEEKTSADKRKEAELLLNPALATNTGKTPDNTAKTNDASATGTVKTPDNTSVPPDNTSKTNDALAVNNSKTSDNTAAAPDHTAKTNDAAAANTVKTPDNSSTADNTAKSNDAVSSTDNTPGNTDPDNITEPNAAGSSSEKSFTYSSPSASGDAAKAAGLTKEAEDLTARSSELKNKAAEGSASEKSAAYAEAEKLDQQAQAKKLESAAVVAGANKVEYANNQNALDQYADATKGNTADDISMAEMLKDEAAIYFKRAEDSRTSADKTSVYYEKETDLDEAYKNEMKALEKQQKAESIYKKYAPGLVINPAKAPDNSTGTTGSATPDNSSKTSDAVAVNTTKTPGNATKTPDNTSATPDNSTKTNDALASNTTKAPDNTSATDNTTKTNDAVTTGTVKTPDNTAASTDPGNTAKTNDAVTTGTVKSPDNTTAAMDPGNTSKTNDAVTTGTVKTPDNTTAATDPGNTAKTTDAAVTNTNKAPDNTATPDHTTNTSDASAANTVKTPDNTSTNPSSNSSAAKVADVFVKTTRPVYSASKPIPVNEKLPEGLIFKVQIGAFRNPIPQDLFKGISPITGETTPQGFTRYTAGLFATFATADKVKEEIRALGYKDAFVVAFLNGKRIPMIDAMKMLGENLPANTLAATSSSTDSNPPVASNTTVPSNTTTSNPSATNSTPPVVNQATPANTTNVSTVTGLFLTVQVGVFSQPVSPAKLFNVQPLYTEIAPNGNLRYNTGIYNNVARAVEAKNMVVDAGIKDAFVTAYNNGKRISVPEAEKLIADGLAVFPTGAEVNKLPTFSASSGRAASRPAAGTASGSPPSGNRPAASTGTPSNPTSTSSAPSGTTTPASSGTNSRPAEVTATTPVVSDELKAAVDASNKMEVDSGVVYKVQIGAFKDEVPLDIANKFLKIAKKGIKNYKDENGLTIYTVGVYKSYEEANRVKGEVAQEAEITDAFIVAYNNGAKISVEEAKTLSGQ
ncbi:MAG: hypothetical protein ACJ77K_02615 [Bacteroidia bacterium]